MRSKIRETIAIGRFYYKSFLWMMAGLLLLVATAVLWIDIIILSTFALLKNTPKEDLHE